LIRTVIVRAARDHDLLVERLERRKSEQIRRRLARRIRRTRIQRRGLRELPRRPERAVHFVRRDLDEPLHAMLARRFEEHLGADDVGVNEIRRIGNAAVDMRLGGEVHDRVELVPGKDRLDRLAIGNVLLKKLVSLRMLLGDTGKVRRVTRVAEHIHVRDELRLVVLEHEPHKIAPNKSTPARDQKTHRLYVSNRLTQRQCGNSQPMAADRHLRTKFLAS
jgi:hypothetical protein